MITIESVLSKKNQKQTFEALSTRKNGAGFDNVPMADLYDYWTVNQERIREEILGCEYNPGLVVEYEIINGKGKKNCK